MNPDERVQSEVLRNIAELRPRPDGREDDMSKVGFYERLERTYESYPRHDVEIVLGDFKVRVGEESIFGSKVGKFSLLDETNRLRLIDFTGAGNMFICST